MERASKISTIFLVASTWCFITTAQADYSKSAAEPIKLLLTYIQDDLLNKVEVEITNRHNGIYQLNSVIETSNSSVQISTHVNDMTSTESDTSFTFSKDEFILKLKYELKNSDKQIVIAGNYQKIRIKTGETISEFHTRRAFGLLTLFSDGKSNMIVGE